MATPKFTKPFLKNANVFLEVSDDRTSILMGDLTDPNNLPRIYNETVRGLKDALAEIDGSFSDSTTWSDVKKAFDDRGVKLHFWCAMD